MHISNLGDAIGVQVAMTLVACAKCGIVFGMPHDLNHRRREDGKDFFCPNGDINVYKGELANLKKQAADATARADTAERLRSDAERALLREKEAHAATQKKVAPVPVVPKIHLRADQPIATPVSASKTTPLSPPVPSTIREKVLALLGNGKKMPYKEMATILGVQASSISPVISSLHAQKVVVRIEPGVYQISPAA